MTDPSLGTALVTGASWAIGAIHADRLAMQGHDVIPVACNEARLGSLSGRLANETGRAVEALPADLGNRAERAKVDAAPRVAAARRTISQHFGNNVPGPRYGPSARAHE
jgi:short-subunit dehydrogenase